MRTRHRFQPNTVDALEERQVLSGISSFEPTGILHNLESAFHIHTNNTPRPTVMVGTLGDSYTDEYRFYPPDQSHARNWVEVLAATRKAVSFGSFTTQSRGEPRDQGFASNWARWGATSSDMVQNQLPGVAAQAARAQINYAWIFIGGNDFLYFLQGVRNGSIPASQALTTLAQVESKAEANFTTAVNTLLAANPRLKLVVATVPDVAELPLVQAGATSAESKAIVAATSQAMQQYNATITALASAHSRIALVDLAGQSAQIAQSPSSTVSFGGTTINLATPGDDYHDFFLADGVHIGTVAQGIIADDFINAIDTHFGAKVRPLAATQIVRFARQVQAQTRHGAGPP